MKRRGFTLAEIMISVFIFVVGIGAIFAVYPPLFEGVEVTFQTMKAWGECRKEMETLKNRSFSDDLWSEAATPNPHNFLNGSNVMHGVYYLDKIPCTVGSSCSGGVLTDALRITVSVSVRAKNRVIGEDQLLSGDTSQDANGNGLLDSPISLTTIVISQ